MSDIVERLRLDEGNVCGGPPSHPLQLEAAAEIESLRAKVAELYEECDRLKSLWLDLQMAAQKVAELENSVTVWHDAFNDMRDKLNAALAREATLRGCLEECLDDSRAALADMLAKYGEKYRPDRLKYQRELIAKAEEALNAQPADEKEGE